MLYVPRSFLSYGPLLSDSATLPSLRMWIQRTRELPHREGPTLTSETSAIYSFLPGPPHLGVGAGGGGARCCNSLAWFLLHTKALAQIGLFVNEDFSRDNISKRHEHLQNVLVSKLLWKVVNKEVCTLWT